MLGKCALPISSTQGKQRGEEAPGDHLGGEHGGHHDGEDGGEDGGHDHCGGEVGDGAGTMLAKVVLVIIGDSPILISHP